MHGCGNDFVVIDDRAGRWHAQREVLAAALCDRRKGVGGDGLILIEAADDGADFRMTYVNRTGVDGEMCGNGARCTVLRAAQLGLIATDAVMATDAGRIQARIDGGSITLGLTPPLDERRSFSLEIEAANFEYCLIDTGVPHAVAFLEDRDALECLDVERIGRAVRHDPTFAPRGVNANFAARLADGSFRMRTYERGVEMETLACGTGAVAVGLMAHRRYGSASPVLIHPTGGGILEIRFQPVPEGRFHDVSLTGPAELIAEGEVSAAWLAARGLSAVSAG
jgi:diaminopimelate epimerase